MTTANPPISPPEAAQSASSLYHGLVPWARIAAFAFAANGFPGALISVHDAALTASKKHMGLSALGATAFNQCFSLHAEIVASFDRLSTAGPINTPIAPLCLRRTRWLTHFDRGTEPRPKLETPSTYYLLLLHTRPTPRFTVSPSTR